MKKVLILANSSGGLYDFRNEFVKELTANYDVYVSVPDETRTQNLIEEGCHIIKTAINRRGINPIEDFKLYLTYRKLIKEINPDLVITYTIKCNIYGGYAAGRLKKPYISTITGLGGAFDKKGLFLKLVVFLYRQGLKKAGCVFFQNAENKGIFENYKIKGRDSRLVMGSGVDLERHSFEPFPEGDTVNFVFVGRILKERGIFEYCDAAKQLHSDKVVFNILGRSEEDYEDMLNELESQGVIKQLGFTTEVHPVIASMSCIVVASFHEGMSNSLIEGAATGRPVIASDIFGCKEAVEDGVTGFLFTPGNTDELVSKMKAFIDLSADEQANMGMAGRKKMEQEFDRHLVTAEYMKVARELIK